jgi:large subunit ribosomal protein L15
MPFYRRLPKKGFNRTRFHTVYSLVNLGALNTFEEGSKVTPEVLMQKGLVRNLRFPVKVLGDGELRVKLNVVAHAFSEKARDVIERLGGTCEIMG